MPFRDLLLHIDTYPTHTPSAAIDEAIRLAVSLGGKLTALALEIQIPVNSNRLTDYLIGLTDMAVAEEARSREACKQGLAHFTAQAIEAGPGSPGPTTFACCRALTASTGSSRWRRAWSSRPAVRSWPSRRARPSP